MSETAEFDVFSDDYTEILDDCVRFTGQDSDYFATVKAQELFREFERRGIEPASATVLDFGCGTGSNSAYVIDSVARLIGTDVAGTSIQRAQAKHQAGLFLHTDDFDLPIRSGSVDAVLVSCVLHHIDPVDRRRVVEELRRIVSDRGFVFVVEHNPYNPATRWIVNRCEFDRDAVLLRPHNAVALFEDNDFSAVRRKFILCLPGRGRLVSAINNAMSRLPFGAQYTVSASIAD